MTEKLDKRTARHKIRRLFTGQALCLAAAIILLVCFAYWLAYIITYETAENEYFKWLRFKWLFSSAAITLVMLLTVMVTIPCVVRSKRICLVNVIIFAVTVSLSTVTGVYFLDKDAIVTVIIPTVTIAAAALDIVGACVCYAVFKASGRIALYIETVDLNNPESVTQTPLTHADPILTKTIDPSLLYDPDEKIKHYIVITDEQRAHRKLLPEQIKNNVIYYRDDLDKMWTSDDGGFSFRRA